MGALPYPNPTSSSEWAKDLLAELGDPTNNATSVQNIERVIGAESGGNQAGFLRDNNPFNLNTYTSPHASLPGGVIVSEFGINVQTFPNVQAGLAATASQIEQDPALSRALATGASPSAFGTALSSSAWKSEGYANASKFPTLEPFTGSSKPGSTPNPTGLLGQYVTGPLKWINNLGGGTTGRAGPVEGAITSGQNAVVSGVFGPIAKWLEAGAADVTFIGFGLALVVIGLVVSFKGGSDVNVSSPTGGVGEAGGAAKDAALAAVG
jgi:hypothetical protein